jgi:hypothetical protein
MIPDSGATKGNRTLRDEFLGYVRAQGGEITDADYWTIRDSLIEDGAVQAGRGKGGSVRRVVAVAAEAPPTAEAETAIAVKPESALYDPFHAAIREGYARGNRIKCFVSAITANQGGRNTKGKWTRPDVTLIAMRAYTFLPGMRPARIQPLLTAVISL